MTFFFSLKVYMHVKDKRVLKNGAIGGYVKQPDGSYKWRIVGHSSAKKKNDPTTKKKAPVTKKKTPTTKKKASKKIQMKGGARVEGLLGLKPHLISFLKTKVKRYSGRSQQSRDRKAMFEELLQRLENPDPATLRNRNGNLLSKENRDTIVSEEVRRVINDIVDYYITASSANLKSWQKEKGIFKFFGIYRKAREYTKSQNGTYNNTVDNGVLEFTAGSEVDRVYKRYLAKMPSTNNKYGNSRALAKKTGSKKRSKMMTAMLGVLDKGNRKIVEKLLNAIDASGLDDRWKVELEQMIFVDYEDVPRITALLQRGNVEQRKINKIIQYYREVRGRLRNKKNELENRMRMVKPKKGSNEGKKGNYIMSLMKNTKSLTENERKTLDKKYSFDINKVLKSKKDREIYSTVGRIILELKYAIFSGKNADVKRGLLDSARGKFVGFSNNALRSNQSIRNFTNVEGLIGEYKNKARKHYLTERVQDANVRIQRIDNRIAEIDIRLNEIGEQQPVQNRNARKRERDNLLDERQRLIFEKDGLGEMINDLAKMEAINNIDAPRNYNTRNKEYGIVELKTNVRKMIIAGDNYVKKTKLSNDLTTVIRKNLDQLVDIANSTNERSKLSLKNKLRNRILYDYTIITMLFNNNPFVIYLRLLPEINNYLRRVNWNEITENEIQTATQNIQRIINRISNLSELRERFLIETFNTYLCENYAGVDERLVEQYRTRLRNENEEYSKIMKTAGKYIGTNSAGHQLGYEVYFIYNQIKYADILKDTYQTIVNMAKECNEKIFKQRVENTLRNNNRGQQPVVRGQRENEYRYANVNGRNVRVLYDPTINNNIEVVNGSRVVNNPTVNANAIPANNDNNNSVVQLSNNE